MLSFEATGEVPEQPRRGLHVLALIGPPEDGLHPGPLALRQMVEDVAGLVDLAALHQRGATEDRGDRRPQRLRPIEHGQHASIGAQAAALQVGEQTLTDGCVLRRTFPEPERVFRAVSADAQRNDQTVFADVDAVEQKADKIQVVEGRRLPRGQLRGGLGDKPPTDRTLTHAATRDVGRQRLQTAGVASGADAHQQLLDGAAPQGIGLGHRLEGRQRHFLAARADPGAADRHLAPPEDDFAGHRPGPGGRAVGLVRVARPTERRPILLEHGVQHLQSRPHRKVEQLRFGVNQQLDERQTTRGRRFNTSGRTDCARLLHGGSFAVRRVASGCPPLVYHEQ